MDKVALLPADDRAALFGEILLRPYDLRMISADQYRTGYIHLSKTGQKGQERFDDVIASEAPELLPHALSTLEAAYPSSVGRMVEESGLEREMFSSVSGLELPAVEAHDATVVPFRLFV